MVRKLTKAQMELLTQAAMPGEQRQSRFIQPGTDCFPYYKPAKKLIEFGLARWRRDDPSTHRLIATDAGRGLLTQDQINGD